MLVKTRYKPGLGLLLLDRPRTWSVAALLMICGGAWIYTVLGIGMPMSAVSMTGMSAKMPMPLHDWSPLRAILMFAMWWVMMIAMMIPSAVPMIFLYDRVASRAQSRDSHLAIFVSGYIAVWGMFSLVATILHAVGEISGFVNGMMASASGYFGAVLLVSAGVWQLTETKIKCLEACRSPAAFLSRVWRSGPLGAFQMGLSHGIYCVGCCWAMMLLLFYGGVMNLYWIVGLSVFVFIEKVLPYSPVIGRLLGLALIAFGLIIFAHA